jgi:hypothetical protein
MKIIDTDYEDKRIKEVKAEDGGGWQIAFDDGWSFFVKELEPKVNGFARLYPKGIGMQVRGLFLRQNESSPWEKVFYRTKEEDHERHLKWCDEQEAKRKTEFEASRVDADKRIEALPEPFIARIKWFQSNGLDWRWNHEPYELFVCEQAVEFAKALGTVEKIAEFHKKDWSEQKQMLPALSDEHSGNTFGAACLLARIYLEHPEMLWKAHGALCPLVGCEGYGCFAARKDGVQLTNA